MKEQLRVEHPDVNIPQLEEIVTNGEMPVQRSPHIGNQNASELYLQAYMPAGIIVIAVDTIRGSDNYSTPRSLMLAEGMNIPLAANKASGGVVGSVVVRDDIEDHAPAAVIEMFDLEPGRPVAEIHQESLRKIGAANMPVPMMEYFMREPDILRAVMTAAAEEESICRQVTEAGKIVSVSGQNVSSIFGVHDAAPANQGVLIPLNAMMAADVMMVMSRGASSSLHLGGPDMIRYTRDRERMQEVGALISRTLSLMEARAGQHCLKIADITGYGEVLDAAQHISQHAMVVSNRVGILGEAVTSRQKVMA